MIFLAHLIHIIRLEENFDSLMITNRITQRTSDVHCILMHICLY